MACVALASLMATIELEFLQSIPRVSLQEDAPIKSLFDNLSSLQKKSSAAIKDLEIKIRDFALKAEDGIEIQLSNFLLAKDGKNREKASRELHQTLREAAEKAAELLEIINSTTGGEADEANETQPSIRDFESQNVELDGSLGHPPRLENKMVGRDDDYAMIKYQLVDKIVEDDGIELIIQRIMDRMGSREYNEMAIRKRLRNRMDDSFELKLIWIVGMPGIGKTALAKSIYEDPTMKAYFDVQGWITMPQIYNQRKILCNLLLSIGVATDAIRRIPPSKLADQVRKCLLGRRFLIVLDNLWNNRAWDDIKQCFPYNNNGSRILLTTTHFDRDSYVSSYYYIHYMNLLDPNHCWDIFCNILSRKEHMAPIFENIRSREIVEKCDGLPQSIATVAKRLSRSNNIQQEGKRIEKELDSIGILDRTALTFVLNQLPYHLKVCFLYLGVFPRRSEIMVKMLIRLWVAEGFVKSEYEAYSYLQELIDRSLVLMGKWSSDGKIKTCRIHTELHSFCAREAQSEGIFCAVNTHQHLGLPLHAFANSCRWLSFCTHSFDYYVLFSTNNSRSIFFFHENHEMCAPSNMLRVLVFVSSPFLQRVPKHLGNLVFLRYLSVAEWFEGLDDIVSVNPNLQTLIVSHSESQLGGPTLQLPSRIWEPPQLRHLELGNMYTVDPPSMVKENLQTLSLRISIHCWMDVFSRFPYIKKLKIFYCDYYFWCNDPCILDRLVSLEQLEMLSISALVGLNMFRFRQFMFPSQLKKLRLSRTYLDMEYLMVIGKLPQLEVLKLENAFHGNVWKIADEGFYRLKFLLVKDDALKELRAYCDGLFPCLERLVLRSCYCLEEIPLEFVDIPTLHSIELDMCSRSSVMSAKRIQEERYDYGDELFKVTVLRPEYEESQYTHSDDSVEDDLKGITVK